MEGELYYSNNGRGPMVARIVARRPDGTLIMERRPTETKGRWVKFELPEKLLARGRSGWRKSRLTKNAADLSKAAVICPECGHTFDVNLPEVSG